MEGRPRNRAGGGESRGGLTPTWWTLRPPEVPGRAALPALPLAPAPPLVACYGGPNTDEDTTIEDDDTTPDECTEASRLVYVIDQDGRPLHSFQPSSGTLAVVGTLNGSSGGEPASMVVTRDGLACVRYEYGMGSGSGAFQVNPGTDAMSLLHPDRAIDIVGTGVSACAPVVAP